jgi:hypothetical protein
MVFEDVVSIYSNLAYAVGNNNATNEMKVYEWDGKNWSVVYSSDAFVAKGVDAVSSQDVWVVTTSSGSYFHYDGSGWSYYQYPYGGGVSIVIGFNSSIGVGTEDISLFSGVSGYSVGADGLVLKLEDRFSRVLSDLDYLNSSYQSFSNESISYLQNITVNTSYIRWYLENTIYPLLSSIGIAVNETRLIANETRAIANNTYVNVSELVDRSRRIRAWVQQ